MRFQVPQYIEVEDKIFGPLTLKQFLYLVGSCGMAFIAYRFLGLFLGLLIGIPVVIFGALLAFYKHNHKPFAFLVEAALKYASKQKLYLWRKIDKPITTHQSPNPHTPLFVPKMSEDKLKDITWGIATKENILTEQVPKKASTSIPTTHT